ncbi:MAG: chemotaxis protein CheD [Candidatus Omnitrophica bacterium]|nr:chemotaxis protein CheD [Candidatus Omnitrophota bacterium]MCM8826208.1 chemotaxis protein CheD [Candidatus Omnitrophota bacterium]
MVVEEIKIIEVGMGEFKISSSPHILVTRGLGSCLGITLYDYTKKIGGLAHPMLPDIDKAQINSNPTRFVNSVIEKMVDELKLRGCSVNSLVAKIFGGAHMFTTVSGNSIFNVGTKNIEKAKESLNNLKIRISAEDVGGNFGRTIEFYLDTGKVKVKTIFYGEKEL